ncbi:MAG: tripartite tricarboxylate transporter substrate binding protein [Burkholderiaceae bacterium]
MRKNTVWKWLGGVALSVAQVAAVHAADPFPNKPIRLIVGFVPGGGTDVSARLIAQKLSEELGQQVVVENKPGASGLIAADSVSKSDPDGYTLLLANMQSTVAAPYLLPTSFDPVNGFTAVTFIGTVPNVLVVNPTKNDVTTLAQLLEQVKAKPGVFTYASSGMGSPQHLSAARFSQITGTKMEHVPYKGSGQAIADLLGGQVDMNFDTLPSVIGQINSGKLRALAVTSQARSDRLPNVPTLAEAGVKGMDVEQWYAVLGPAKIPAATLKRLDQAIGATLRDPGVASKLADQGMTLGGGPKDPQAFATFLTSEHKKYQGITADLNLSKP